MPRSTSWGSRSAPRRSWSAHVLVAGRLSGVRLRGLLGSHRKSCRGDARSAGSFRRGDTPRESSRHRARPVTDTERIRSPDGTDAGNRYTWAHTMRLRLVCMVVVVTHGSRRSLLESRELNT